MNLNQVTICGHVGQDPELRYTANQNAVCNISVATTNYSKESSGEKKESTEWHRIVLWGKTAEATSKYVVKGSLVLVCGRISTHSYDDKNGVKRYQTDIICHSIQFMSSNNEKNIKPENQGDLDEIPF